MSIDTTPYLFLSFLRKCATELPEFKCSGCDLLMRKVYENSEGQLFCQTCTFNQSQDNDKPDQLLPPSIHQSVYLTQKIQKQIFPCLKPDCKFTGTLNGHLTHLLTCDYVVDNCPYCQVDFMRKDLVNHLCGFETIKCSQESCQQHVLRGELSEHLNVCAYVEVSCPTQKWSRCQIKGFRKDINQHVTDCCQQHANGAAEYVAELKETLKSETDKSLKNIALLQSQFASLNVKNKQLEAQSAEDAKYIIKLTAKSKATQQFKSPYSDLENILKGNY